MIDLTGITGVEVTANRRTLLIALALLATACLGPAEQPAVPDGPAADNAVMRPDLFAVSPADPVPGDVVEVRWRPADQLRGQCWSLEVLADDGWKHRFDLTSTSAGTPPWSLANDPKGAGCTDVGISDPEADRLLIPGTATPDTYRLCQLGQDITPCVEIAVIAASD